MPGNKNLNAARVAKNNEFYTLYADVEREMLSYLRYNPEVFRGKTILLPCDNPEQSNFTKYFARNFDQLGLRKLISTSYAGPIRSGQISLFDETAIDTPKRLYEPHGRIAVLDHAICGDDIPWDYLDGNGDFRSKEITALRDEADMILTNVPFSLLQPFLFWVLESGKQFAFIGNMNSITCNNTFPLLASGQIWLGATQPKVFITPDGNRESFGNTCWITNIDHGLRHEPIPLMSMQENIAHNERLRRVLLERYKQNPNALHYEKYRNYDGIEVPILEVFPSDYTGVAGVPISVLNHFCAEQMELVGCSVNADAKALGVREIGEEWIKAYREHGGTGNYTAHMHNLVLLTDGGVPIAPFKRILVRLKAPDTSGAF